MKTTRSCSVSHILSVLASIGCLFLSTVRSQGPGGGVPEGPVTLPPVRVAGSPNRGTFDIGDGCLVDLPCNPAAHRGYYAHPSNCSKYYQCDARGRMWEKSCLSLTWDHIDLTCVPEGQKKCQSGCPTGSRRITSTVPGQVPRGEVPVRPVTLPPLVVAGSPNRGTFDIGDGCLVDIPCNLSVAGYYAHPSNCSKYYQCAAGGRLIERSCWPLTWNHSDLTCVPEGQKGCHSGCPAGSRLPTTTATTTAPWIHEISTNCEVQMPCIPGAEIANPDDCQMYYTCQDNGNTLEPTRCKGRNQYYNYSRGRCLGTGAAGCVNKDDCPAGSVRKGSNVESTTTTSSTKTTQAEVNADGPCNPPPVCTKGQKLPDPENCKFYFQCTDSLQWELKECPFLFDSVTLNCGFGGCPLPCTTTAPNITTTAAVITTTIPVTTTLAIGTIDIGVNCEVDIPCNQRFAPAFSFVPHPDDCAMFYECLDNGQMDRRKCSAGSLFNATSRNCELEGASSRDHCQRGCPMGSRPKQVTSTTTTASPSTVTTLAPPPFAPRDEQVCKAVPTGRCSGIRQKIAHPTDCRKFLLCLLNTYSILDCPNGNHFDAVSNKCEDPAIARCHPPCTTTTASTTSSTTTTTTAMPITTSSTTTTPAPQTTTSATSTTGAVSTPTTTSASTTGVPSTTTAAATTVESTTTSTTQSTTAAASSSTTSAVPSTTTTKRPSTTTSAATTTTAAQPGTNTTEFVPGNSSAIIAENSTSTTQATTTTDPKNVVNQTGPLWDLTDGENTVTNNSVTEQSTTIATTTPIPSQLITDKEPPVTSDGILLPSEFVTSSPDSMLSSSSESINPSVNSTMSPNASLTQDDISVIPHHDIQPQSQTSHILPSDTPTVDNNTTVKNTIDDTVTMEPSQSLIEGEILHSTTSFLSQATDISDTTAVTETTTGFSSAALISSSEFKSIPTESTTLLGTNHMLSRSDIDGNTQIDTSESHSDPIYTSEGKVVDFSDTASIDQSISRSDTVKVTPPTTVVSVVQTTSEVTSLNSVSPSAESFPSTMATSASTEMISTAQATTNILSSQTSDQTTVTDTTTEVEASTSVDSTYSSISMATEVDTSTSVDSTYSSVSITTELTSPETQSMTDSTSLSPSAPFSDSTSSVISSTHELTASESTTRSQLDNLDVTTELIHGSTMSVDVNVELTNATNPPESVLASASLDTGGVLGTDTDHMTPSHDFETTTHGIGHTVTEDIFCEQNFAKGTLWSRTRVGSRDKKPCPDNREGTARRACVPSSGEIGMWLEPDFSLCVDPVYSQLVKNLELIEANPYMVTPIMFQNLTRQLQNLTIYQTQSPEGLSPGNLNASVDALKSLVNIGSEAQNISDQQVQTLMDTASTLLSPNNMNSWKTVLEEDEDSAVSLMSTLDNFGTQLAKRVPLGQTRSFTTSNIVIQAKSVPIDTDYPVLFPVTPAKRKVAGPPPVRQGIKLEAETIEHLAEVVPGDHLVIWSSHYITLSELLPITETQLINSDIISLTIEKLPPGTKLDPGVKISFALENSSLKNYNPVCSFWKYNGSEGGQWSSEGCRTVYDDLSAGVQCECNHLTNFAVLMSPYVAEGMHADILSLISTIGCLLSIVGCTITICLYFLCWKRIKSHHAAVLLNLCFILIMGNVLFLVGIDRTESELLCTVIAVGMHYIWLAAFFVMLADGVEFILYVVYVFHVKRCTETFLLLFTAYVLPAVIVGISASITMLKGYGDDKVCWLSWDNGLVFAFIIPAVLVIVVNFGILIKILCTVGKSEGAKQADRCRVRATIWNIAVILPLLGITWIFGIFSIDENTLVFQYLFAICSSLQGFAIFIFHCILNKKLREAVGQRFSSGWSSAGSYKSSRSVKSNKSDKLVKKMIKRDQKKYGANNKGYVANGSQDSKDQSYSPYHACLESESPIMRNKINHSNGDTLPQNAPVRYQNGALHQRNGAAQQKNGVTQNVYQKNPSPMLPHKAKPHNSNTRTLSEETFRPPSAVEHQFQISDNASTYMVMEPEYLDTYDPGYQNDSLYYDGKRPTFRNSGIVILGYNQDEKSLESESF